MGGEKIVKIKKIIGQTDNPRIRTIPLLQNYSQGDQKIRARHVRNTAFVSDGAT
jgi:hypothetical protein